MISTKPTNLMIYSLSLLPPSLLSSYKLPKGLQTIQSIPLKPSTHSRCSQESW